MKKCSFLIFLIIFISGCSISYNEFYKLNSDYLKQRQISTRYFETNNEKELIIASAQLLQDLGYIIEESNIKLGLITASKNREILSDAKTGALTAFAVIDALFGANVNTNFPKMKELKATLISTKSNTKKGYLIIVEFSSAVYYTHGNVVLQRDTNTEIYKEFFDKLGQSVFITPNDI